MTNCVQQKTMTPVKKSTLYFIVTKQIRSSVRSECNIDLYCRIYIECVAENIKFYYNK